jgi:hypothetical protein
MKSVKLGDAEYRQIKALAAKSGRFVTYLLNEAVRAYLKGGMVDNFMVRQGDVLLRKVDKLPDGKRKRRASGEVLEGEVTGHVHRITDLEAAEVLEIGDGLFVSVSDNGVSLIHEEHKTIELPPGNYEVVRQREYSPEEIRNVQD